MKGTTRLALSPLSRKMTLRCRLFPPGVRGPFVANEGRESARIVRLFRRLDRLLPGASVGGRAGERKERLRERSLRKRNDHFDRRIGSLSRLDHVVPPAASGIGQDVGLAGKEVRKEPHIVGVVGNHEKIERPRELRRLSRRRDNLLALGEAIGVARAEPSTERAGVERKHRVQVRVAEERPGRKVASRVRRVSPLVGKHLVGGILVERAHIGDEPIVGMGREHEAKTGQSG